MWKTKKRIIINVLVGIVFLVAILTFYSTFSLEDGYKFESMVYEIDGAYVNGVSVNTNVGLYKKYFDLENCSIKVVDKDNKEIKDGYVVNGSKTIVYDSSDNVIASYTNIIKGDFNSDGIIDTNDFDSMGECLVDECTMDEFLELSVDIDGDGEFLINDVTLLDKAVTLGYTGIIVNKEEFVLQSEETTRVVGKIEPDYGVNLNVKWSSLDESIATVDEAGIVTGHSEGETYIVGTTMDGKYEAKAKVKVDNTIQLESYEGIGYVDGDDKLVKIKSIDYDGITCSVSDESIASCQIDGKNLVLKALKAGDVTVTVTSSKYGEVTYKFSTYSVYLNVMPRYLCMSPGSAQLITVSGFNSGNLSFESSDSNVISSAYMTDYNGRKMLRINSGTKQDRATLKVTESNANTTNVVTVDVYSLTLADIGKFVKVGEEVSTTIKGDNLGQLSCISNDTSKGTCRIEDRQLIVTTLGTGTITVTVYNKFDYNGEINYCGEVQFLVVVQE